MKICGIYYKKNKILIRILGQSKKIYSINIFIINGHFNCSCKYHLKYNICKHIFNFLFKILKVFSNWLSSDSDIFLRRRLNWNVVNKDETFLNGKLNEITILLIKKNLRKLHFKILDQKLYELDNFYLRYKKIDNPIHKKYINQNSTPFEGSCLICFNDNNNNFKCPSCKKIFHSDCINKWIIINPTCPHCRYNMNDYNEYIKILNMEYNSLSF